MLRALGVFSAVPSIVVGLFLVAATLAVFVHALWTVRLEVRLDATSSQNAADLNAPPIDRENSLPNIDDVVEANGGANEGLEPRSTNTTSSTNAQAQGANGGSGRWLSYLQSLCVAEGGQEQLTDDDNRNDGIVEAHSPRSIELEMIRMESPARELGK